MDNDADLISPLDLDFSTSPDSIKIECELDPQNILAAEFSNQSLQVSDESNSISDTMGIENTWSQDECFSTSNTTSNFPIPLPPPPSTDTCEGPENFALELGSLFETPEENDVSDNCAQPGVCGIRNLGNTCFMSAGIQSLVATSSLVDFFNNKTDDDMKSSAACSSLVDEFALLVQKMWSGRYSIVHPNDFKQILGVHYPQFKDYRQHDCQEFLALLLDGLHEQLNTASSEPPNELLSICNTAMKDSQCTSTSLLENNNLALPDKDFLNLKKEIKGENKVINELKSNLNSPSSSSNHSLNQSSNNTIQEKSNNSFYEKSNKTINEKFTKSNQSMNEKSTNLDVVHNFLSLCDNEFDIKDIMKDAKTSNVNVLVTEQEANNEIRFDSDKFPRKERRRECVNVNSFTIYDNSTTAAKRNKTVGQSAADLNDGNGDLKRIKMYDDQTNFKNAEEREKNFMMEISRNKSLEKNIRMECERKKNINMLVEQEDEEDVTMTDGATSNLVDLQADKHWQLHLSDNQSILVDLFQGQFKSTVVCAGCQFVSVTYEPFMYLSVPLPYAMEQQICITYLPASNVAPIKCLVTVNKQDRVSHIKENICKLFNKQEQDANIILAEVLDHHIAKFLENNSLVRYVNDMNRKVYAFEQIISMEDPFASSNELTNDLDSSILSLKCTICLEEKESNIKKHLGCTCSLCDECVASSFAHYNETTSIPCPVCKEMISPDKDLINIENCSDVKPTLRMLNIPVVFRMDIFGDGNNKNSVDLFGHPRLISVSNRISADSLHDMVRNIQPYTKTYKLLLVDGQGSHCSRCMFNAHCRGCPVPTEGLVTLFNSDTLAVAFSQSVEELPLIIHGSLSALRSSKTLSLYDCIKAFSQSELLDEHNPWFCPKCENNQCATKTLSVCRYPDYLIVYLKRFVFHECMSLKLEDKVDFPLTNLVMSHCSFVYDLYACVCHIGGVSAGHYTSYTLHPTTREWHYFNDENVLEQKPQEEDFNNAYILFYKKRDGDLDGEVAQ